MDVSTLERSSAKLHNHFQTTSTGLSTQQIQQRHGEPITPPTLLSAAIASSLLRPNVTMLFALTRLLRAARLEAVALTTAPRWLNLLHVLTGPPRSCCTCARQNRRQVRADRRAEAGDSRGLRPVRHRWLWCVCLVCGALCGCGFLLLRRFSRPTVQRVLRGVLRQVPTIVAK